MRRNRAAGTIKAYRWALDDLAAFVGAAEFAADLTPRLLERWQDRLKARDLSPGSRQMAVTACRSLLTFARRQRLPLAPYLVDALDEVKVPRRLPRPIPRADFERLVAHLAPRRPRSPIADLRTRALFFYLLYSGARISEVLQLTRDEIDRAIVWQKGGTQKVLYVPIDAVEYVADYLRARSDDCPWLWINHDGDLVHRLSADGVRDIWKRLCARVGVPYFTTHQLRHSHATYSHQAGIPDSVISRQLGHVDGRMMEVYRRIDDSEREAGVDALQELVRGIAGQSSSRPRLLPRLRRRAGGRG